MQTRVFLSLSYVDEILVQQIYDRLPRGYALFYKRSFENGELLLDAMERSVEETTIFVLFASKLGLESPWVNFEIDLARIQKIKKPNYRILVFPTDASVAIGDLPKWLRDYWVAKAGWSAADISRYITYYLLDPTNNASIGTMQVIGRGQTLDYLVRGTADQISRTGISPNVYFLSGLRGVGRKTFANYFMRTALIGEANLGYGPKIELATSADLADLHSAIRRELTPMIRFDSALEERQAFDALSEKEQVAEVVRLLTHYETLGQAVTLITSGGFFEDRGEPKQWLIPLINAIPSSLIMFMISNRGIDNRIAEQVPNLIQLRVPELSDGDIKSIMVFAARRAGVENLNLTPQLIQAIGGHADVAKAAVRLIESKGEYILSRDPSQLYNFQNIVLGDSVTGNALTEVQRNILCLLSWVPILNGALLERTLETMGVTVQSQIEALEDLILACLVIPTGSDLQISPAIRMLFRRFNITPPELLRQFSEELKLEWREGEACGMFRSDLFDAFIFMSALEGSSLPNELKPLLTPGLLQDVIRETYARGKDDNDDALLKQVINWGEIASSIRMSEATREEILGTVARAYIRMGDFSGGDKIITRMETQRYRSVSFLRGHSLRRQNKFAAAIGFLKEAVRDGKNQRSAIHELALSYKRAGQTAELKALLKEHQYLITDSATFADFQIGVDLARHDLEAVRSGIKALSLMPDDDYRSAVRQAQLIMKQGFYPQAFTELSALLDKEITHKLRVRCLRATCATRSGKINEAQKDIEFIRRYPAWKNAVLRLDADLFTEKGAPDEALKLLDSVGQKSPEDWLLYARALEKKATMPNTSLPEAKELERQASELRAKNSFSLEYDFVD